MIELLHQLDTQIKQRIRWQGVIKELHLRSNQLIVSVAMYGVNTLITHIAIIAHLFPDILGMSHLQKKNIIVLWIQHLQNIRKDKVYVQQVGRIVAVWESVSLLTRWPLMCHLYFPGLISGEVASCNFVPTETKQGFMTCSVETFHLWISCTILLEKNLHLFSPPVAVTAEVL